MNATEKPGFSNASDRAGELEIDLTLLLEAASVLLVSRSSADVLGKVIELGQRIVSADAYSVWRRRREDGAWVLGAAAGISDRFVKEAAISSLGHPELPSEPMLVDDVDREPLLAARRSSLKAEGIRSLLVIPLRIHEQDSGTIVFYWRTQHRFTPEETRRAKAFGNLGIAALASAELIERQTAEFNVVTDNLPALISCVDSQHRYRSVNRAYEALFGLKREEILGKPVAEIMGPETYEVAKPHLERALMGEPARFRARVRHHDGTLRDFEASYTPDIASDGAVRGVVAMMHDTTEWKRAQEARAHLAAIIDSSDDAIVSKTLDGIITSWNVGAERIFGYSASEAVGSHISLIIPADRRPEEDDVLTRLRRGERIDHFETERRTKDGRRINISLTVSPVRDPEGNIIGASKTARDITDSKRSEELLRASEHYLHAVLDSMPECVKVLGPDGTVLQMNDAGLSMLEADSPGQVMGKCVYPLIKEKDREAFRSLNEGVFSGELGGTLEFGITGLKGTERIFESNIVPLLGAQNKPVGALSVTRDISGRKRIEAERRASLAREQKARETAELLNRVGPILSAELDPQKLAQKVTDLATRAVRAEVGALFQNVLNQNAESYLQSTLSGISRETFDKFRMPPDMQDFGAAFRGDGPVSSDDITKDPGYRENFPFDGMPAGYLPVRSYLATPVVSRNGTVMGGLFFGHSQAGVFGEEEERIAMGIAAQAAIALDNAALFSESQRSQHALRLSNEELKRANDDLNQFAHSASHDLQEPLRTIAIYSQLLQQKVENTLDAEGDQFLAYVLEGANRMESLIRDLLAYSQASTITEGPAPMTDANTALDTALSNLRAAIESSGATVEPGALPHVRMAEVPLTQLFQNLIGNAIKYRSEKAPRIKVRAQHRRREWCFSIEDNGIGIQEQYKEQIFGVFKRLHTAIAYSGTGIGLAICRRILERAGGRIWVESQFGRGSTFFFTVPSDD